MIKLKHGEVSKSFVKRTKVTLSLIGYICAVILVIHVLWAKPFDMLFTFISLWLFLETLPNMIIKFKWLMDNWRNKQ